MDTGHEDCRPQGKTLINSVLHHSHRKIRCTRENLNKVSNLSALVAQTFLSSCWDSTWFTITSKNTITLLEMLFIKLKS